MSHECPTCGQECYCDQEDTGGMPVPDDCECEASHEGERDPEDYGYSDDESDGCVLGDKCCCPHLHHKKWECFTAEEAARQEAEANGQQVLPLTEKP